MQRVGVAPFAQVCGFVDAAPTKFREIAAGSAERTIIAVPSSYRGVHAYALDIAEEDADRVVADLRRPIGKVARLRRIMRPALAKSLETE